MTPTEHASSLLKFVRSISTGLLKDMPDSAMLRQNAPTDNHALWVMGHLALTDSWITGVVGAQGVRIPDSYKKVFDAGTTPVSDPKVYPPVAEVREVFDAARAALIQWLESAPQSALTVSLKEKTGGFALDPIDAVHKIAWHEGWHFGQVASVRKSLKLPPVMG